MKRRLLTFTAVAIVAVSASTNMLRAQFPGTGNELVCLQHPITLECGPTWIHNCWCNVGGSE